MASIVDRSTRTRTPLRLVPSAAPGGEVCVLLDPGLALVWLHGDVDGDLAADLAEAATDLLDAGLPVTVHAAGVTSCDRTALVLVGRLVAAGLPVRIVDPAGHLTRALQWAVHPANV
jgi:hypothetical protein